MLGWKTDEARERQRWRKIVAGSIDDVDTTGGTFEELWRHFAEPSSWEFYPDVLNTLKELRAAGFRLAVASNFDRRILSILHAANEYLEGIFFSAEIGHCKPSARFFAAMEKSLDLGPEQLLMVGDRLDKDVSGAAECGWNVILLDREGRSRTAGVRSIRSLDELPALLA